MIPEQIKLIALEYRNKNKELGLPIEVVIEISIMWEGEIWTIIDTNDEVFITNHISAKVDIYESYDDEKQTWINLYEN